MTNNLLIPVIAMAEAACFGYCSWEVEFARMVREGRSDRTYWRNIYEMLEIAVKTGAFVGRTVSDTLRRLGLSMNDFRNRRCAVSENEQAVTTCCDAEEELDREVWEFIRDTGGTCGLVPVAADHEAVRRQSPRDACVNASATGF
jgi:hypothetical protein